MAHVETTKAHSPLLNAVFAARDCGLLPITIYLQRVDRNVRQVFPLVGEDVTLQVGDVLYGIAYDGDVSQARTFKIAIV